MGNRLVYVTTSSDVIDWHSALMAKQDELNAVLRVFLDEVTNEIGPDERAGGAGRNCYTRNGAVVGIVPTGDEQEKTPAGWRFDAYGSLVPHRGTKIGKAWQAKMDALRVIDVRREAENVGVLHEAIVGMRWYEPAIQYDGGKDGEPITAMYQIWSDEEVAADVEDAIKLNGINWTRMKLSDWYARLEEKDGM